MTNKKQARAYLEGELFVATKYTRPDLDSLLKITSSSGESITITRFGLDALKQLIDQAESIREKALTPSEDNHAFRSSWNRDLEEIDGGYKGLRTKLRVAIPEPADQQRKVIKYYEERGL